MNAALGTKRHCPSCQAKFYDMQRSPVRCPKCSYQFPEAKPAKVAVAAVKFEPKKTSQTIDDVEIEDDDEIKQMGAVVELEDLHEFDDDGDVEHLEEVEDHHEDSESDPNSDDADDEMFMDETNEYEDDLVDDPDDGYEEVDFR